MIIFYSGMGRRDNNVYFTVDTFLNIMRENISNFNTNTVILSSGTKDLPAEFPLFSIEDWVEFTGARILNIDGDENLVRNMNYNWHNTN